MNRLHHLTRHGRHGREAGSVTIAALGVLTITLALVGSALVEASSRFRTSHHSIRWTQAGQAAEAGAEIALLSGNANTWVADGWSAAPGAPGAAPVTRTVAISSAASATGTVNATIAVDKLSFGGAQWLRIRSTGQADIAGGAVAGLDPRDNLLRKLSLRHDRQAGSSVTTPRATRTVEILAEPRAVRPFQWAFVCRELFDMRTHAKIDSYDSRDSSKSDFGPFGAYGVYTPSKKQANGDIATTDALHTWNLNGANIDGDVHTPTGDVDHANRVTGSIFDGFEFTFPDEVSPNWTVVTQNHGVVTNTSKTITAGSQASPTRHKFTSINLTNDSRNIQIKNPAGKTESWIELWITGDTVIDGKKATGIKIDPGVHCTIHFGGKVEIKASPGGGSYGLLNGSQLASNLVVRAYGGASGAIKDFILTDSDFWGVVSAPWYKVKFDGPSRNIHGAFLSWQFDVSDLTKLHYDEALSDFSLGQGRGLTVRSWVEAVR
jgi:hypothetical protein